MARVLVVDDSVFARHRIQQLLESDGHEVVGSSASGAEAVAMYKSLHPDLVTLDHLMDDLPGEAALQEILQFDPAARVIMISGSNDESLERRVLAAGARAFVEKFNDRDGLLKVVGRVMSEPG